MTKNNSKKKEPQTNPRPVTERVLEKVLNRYIGKAIETVGAKIGETKKFLEAKIEYSRKDADEQIISTARSTETVLRKEMAEGFAGTQGAIKSVKKDVENLGAELKATREELKTDIENARVELRSEMKSMETRLSDKIDTRIDDHEVKLANIAHPAH